MKSRTKDFESLGIFIAHGREQTIFSDILVMRADVTLKSLYGCNFDQSKNI